MNAFAFALVGSNPQDFLTAKEHGFVVFPCLVREVHTETSPEWALVGVIGGFPGGSVTMSFEEKKKKKKKYWQA